MKTVYRKALLTFLALAVLACGCAFVMLNADKSVVSAYDCAVSTAEPLKTIYNLQDTVNIPSAELDYKGTKYPADKKVIVFPNGVSYQADSATLTMAGTYTVKYSCEADNKILNGSVCFDVHEKLFSVSGEGGSATYQENLSIKKVNGKSGIAVALPMGGEFTYNKVIDLSKKQKIDRMIELYTMPTTEGVPEAANFMVKLTDAYNPDNYVVITTYDNIDKNNKAICNSVYQLANAYNQPPTGVGLKENGTIDYNGAKYSLHRNSYYGYYGRFSFSAYVEEGGQHHPFYLSMDYSKKTVYGCAGAVATDGMIADLDAPQFFGTLWEGFTTGEVILSVYSTNLLASTFNFAITGIYDEDLSEASVSDTKAPLIQVDLAGEAPYAIKGQPYKIFDAVAVDNYSDSVKLNKAVYYNYKTNYPINVDIKNGYFTPERTGVYTIVYSAVDGSGNTAFAEVEVEVKPQSLLDLTWEVKTNSPKVGEAYQVESVILGNSGSASLTVTATLQDNDKVSYTLTKEGDIYSFIPLYAGKYDLKLTLEDNLTKKEASKEITVSAVNAFYQIGQPNLPYLFIKDGEYAIDGLQAYDLSSGTPVVTDGKIEYAFGDGEFTPLTTEKITIPATDKVVIKYVFGQNQYAPTYTVPVTDVNYKGKLAIDKYFYGKDFTSVAEKDGSIYTTSTDGATLAFANSLLAVNFELSYINTVMAFETQTLEFTDVNDTEEKLTVKLIPAGKNQTYVLVDGEYSTLLSMDLGKNKVNVKISDTGVLYVNGNQCDAGEFNGFTSNLVKLKLTLDGVVGESKIKIERVNSQPISSDTTDRVVPSMNYALSSKICLINEELTVSDILIADVLRLDTEISFSVKGPDGKFCKTKDGVEVKNLSDITKAYTVVLNQFGDYQFTGTYTDGKLSKRFLVNISVVDVVAPTLTVTSEIKTVEMGKEVTFDQYEVTDNLDAEVKVNVYVMDVEGRAVLLENGKFTANAYGVHTVIFEATDSNNNVTIKSYTFNVQ